MVYLASSNSSQVDIHVRIARLLAEAPAGVGGYLDLMGREIGVVPHRAAPAVAEQERKFISKNGPIPVVVKWSECLPCTPTIQVRIKVKSIVFILHGF